MKLSGDGRAGLKADVDRAVALQPADVGDLLEKHVPTVPVEGELPAPGLLTVDELRQMFLGDRRGNYAALNPDCAIKALACCGVITSMRGAGGAYREVQREIDCDSLAACEEIMHGIMQGVVLCDDLPPPAALRSAAQEVLQAMALLTERYNNGVDMFKPREERFFRDQLLSAAELFGVETADVRQLGLIREAAVQLELAYTEFVGVLREEVS